MSNTRLNPAARALHRLARKYLGVDGYPMRQPGEKRVMRYAVTDALIDLS